VTQAELDAIYDEAYRGEPFVQVVTDAPSTKHVYGSNLCRIWVRVDPRSGRILALGVIDTWSKGAAGQAVQALNVIFGLPERPASSVPAQPVAQLGSSAIDPRAAAQPSSIDPGTSERNRTDAFQVQIGPQSPARPGQQTLPPL